MSVITEPGTTTWVPKRGDYGADDNLGLVEIVERHNCAQGCSKSGTPEDRAKYGPGGTCRVLARLFIGEPTDHIEPGKDGPLCRARDATGGGG